MTLLNGRLRLETGDLTLLNVDAIVNAANSTLMGGGGVDGAIHRAGGPSILAECRDIRRRLYPSGLPTGKAVLTGAGRLPCRHVIHTVGPVWQGGGAGEEALLRAAYRNSLTLAGETGIGSVAFPAISTGVYGYPPDKAAAVVWDEVREWVGNHALPREVILVFFREGDRKLVLDVAGVRRGEG